MTLSGFAAWLRSLTGDEARAAAVKPACMSRRGFLRAMGVTAGGVLLGGAAVPVAASVPLPATTTEFVWSSIQLTARQRIVLESIPNELLLWQAQTLVEAGFMQPAAPVCRWATEKGVNT